MNRHELYHDWLAEEAAAQIHGWDFSHIHGRYEEEDDLPWDYRRAILDRLQPQMKLLDMDTGGGEFLLSLGHPHANTAATEAYPPNADLCRRVLAPLGIDFREAAADGPLPFADNTFDMVINRHGSFCPEEIARVLRPGGVFITQQVGAFNDRELVDLLLPGLPLPFPRQQLAIAAEQFRAAGLTIEDGQEAFGRIRFTDIGALVWFARIIEWEFPGFCVERCRERLMRAQRILEARGAVEGRTHRFFLIARK
ncbi:MAG: class I SAM-dependent methyltransferase [Clostridia bacterium]|nr:class I SAM-dependent methyltransferase [Clostridia bacterium]